VSRVCCVLLWRPLSGQAAPQHKHQPRIRQLLLRAGAHASQEPRAGGTPAQGRDAHG
jgi:hypothetical protein